MLFQFVYTLCKSIQKMFLSPLTIHRTVTPSFLRPSNDGFVKITSYYLKLEKYN